MANKNTIVDINSNPIPACCVFNYRGCSISASTIFNPYISSVEVIHNDEYRYFYTVEDAIDFVNGL